MAPHLSLVRRKARQRGMQEPEDWVALAVQRGCYHYFNQRKAKAISLEDFSDEELAVLLLSVANKYDPMLIRVAAQLLSAPGTDIKTLIQLCRRATTLTPLPSIAQPAPQTLPDPP